MSFLGNISISIKALIAPIVLIIALAAVSLLAILGLFAQREMLGTVQAIALERVTLIDEFVLLSEQVQSDLFRVSVLHFMDMPAQELQPIADRLEQGLSDLDVIYGQILAKWPLDQTEQDLLERMRDPMTSFSQQAKQAAAVAADNPSFGIVLVRSATVPFAEFQEKLSSFRDYQRVKILRTETESAEMARTASTTIISLAIGIGLAGTLAALLISSNVISRPIGAMTALMRQLAEGELSIDVGDTERGDEIGAMARAVEVFRDNAIERDRLDAELRDHEHMLDSLLQVVPVGICLTDEQGRYVLVNDAYCETYEFTRDEIIGQHFAAIMPSDQLAIAKVHYARLLSGDMGIPSIRKRQRHDGSTVWIEAANALLVREDKSKLVITTVRDITERKRAEAEIENLAKFPSENPNPVLRIARDGDILYANEASHPLLEGWHCQIGECLPDRWHQIANETLKLGSSKEIEIPLDDRVLLLTFAPVPEPGYVNVYGLDVTKRRKIEEALRESEARFRTAIESLPFDLFIIGNDGRYIMQNTTSRENWGNFVGRRPEDSGVDRDTLALWRDCNRRAFAGETVRSEIKYQVGGRERIYYSVVSPIYEGDQVQSILGANIDITERKQAEEAMIQASRLEATATLAGGIAHRVNNLMVSVLGYAELLKESVADMPDEVDMLTTISRSAQQAGDLALQMLTFARGARYQPQPTSLNDVVGAVLRTQERSVPDEIEVTVDIAPDLWDVEADPIQMNQVVLTLFDNAVEAIAEKGQIVISTRNVVCETGNHVCLSVQDTGHGMSAETQAKIFEPFFTTKFEGRGLGLAAAYGIVSNHGGQIAVQSEEGNGSTFRVCLPCVSRPLHLE